MFSSVDSTRACPRSCRSLILPRPSGGRGADRTLGLRIVEKTHQPAANDTVGFDHDAVDQFLYRRNVMDQPDHHAAAPGAGFHVAVDHHLGVDASDLIVDVLDLEVSSLLALDLEQALDAGVLQYAFGVAQRPH